MLSDFAAVHCALVSAAVTALPSALVVGSLPPLACSANASSCAWYRPRSDSICGEMPTSYSAACGLLRPSCEAACAACWLMLATPASTCVAVTEMPEFAATWSPIWNLISQLSTAAGMLVAVSVSSLEYGLDAAFRFETWVSSEATVIRWSPTTAAVPILTEEHEASTTHALAAATPQAAARVLLPGLPNTGDPFPGRVLRLGEYRTDDLRAPRQEFGVTQRLPAEGCGLRHRYQHGTHCRLEHRLRVEALNPY